MLTSRLSRQFHVDKLSSAHIYLRMRPGQTWDNLPEELVMDLAQLTKANSIEGSFHASPSHRPLQQASFIIIMANPSSLSQGIKKTTSPSSTRPGQTSKRTAAWTSAKSPFTTNEKQDTLSSSISSISK